MRSNHAAFLLLQSSLPSAPNIQAEATRTGTFWCQRSLTKHIRFFYCTKTGLIRTVVVAITVHMVTLLITTSNMLHYTLHGSDKGPSPTGLELGLIAFISINDVIKMCC